MKLFHLFLIVSSSLLLNTSCTAQSNKNSENVNSKTKNNAVEVYYFHFTHRCATCMAIENVTKEALAEMYGNKVNFTSLNLDESEGELKGKELQVSGQTLIIVSENKKINLTNEAFMNARSNPEKLKEVIKANIDPLL